MEKHVEEVLWSENNKMKLFGLDAKHCACYSQLKSDFTDYK